MNDYTLIIVLYVYVREVVLKTHFNGDTTDTTKLC